MYCISKNYYPVACIVDLIICPMYSYVLYYNILNICLNMYITDKMCMFVSFRLLIMINWPHFPSVWRFCRVGTASFFLTGCFLEAFYFLTLNLMSSTSFIIISRLASHRCRDYSVTNSNKNPYSFLVGVCGKNNDTLNFWVHIIDI